MKIKFIGVGSAFAGARLGNSNMVVEADNGKLLLIDCGFRAQDMLLDAYGINNGTVGNIDSIYVSHLHADHIGGLEWLALCTFFNPACPPPKLYCVGDLMQELWDKSLRGGLETLQVRGKPATAIEAKLTTYFAVEPIKINESFTWEGVKFTPVQTVHVISGFRIQHCYGLMIRREEGGRQYFLTGDTQFAPNQLRDFYGAADIIFHDCETTPFQSGVHAHYDELKMLPDDVKERMYLYHYNSEEDERNPRAVEDGFAGFIGVGQEFEL